MKPKETPARNRLATATWAFPSMQPSMAVAVSTWPAMMMDLRTRVTEPPAASHRSDSQPVMIELAA